MHQVHFGILPCRYPTIESWSLLPPPDPEALEERIDCTHLDVISIDNASTRDIDDALSFEFPGVVTRHRAFCLSSCSGGR